MNIGRMVKESMVGALDAQLAERPNFFVASITSLPASETDSFRRQLHASHARLVMIKRRLGTRSLERLQIPGLLDLLEGSVGLVLPGGDVLPTAKQLVEFIKGHADQMAVRGAVIDGRVLDKQRVEYLAQLPSKPVLLAQVVAAIESPIVDVICTIEQLIGDVAWVVEQAATTAAPDQTTPQPPSESSPSSSA